MADFYPLISRAVAGLERNSGENRRALYERARNALLDQLRSIKPPLTEAEITRERLSLEEAIRKVEADVARRMREEAPRPAPPQPSSQRLREALRQPPMPPRPIPGAPSPRQDLPEGTPPSPPSPESRPPMGRIVGRPDVTTADLRRYSRPPIASPPLEDKAPEPAPPELHPSEPELPDSSPAFAPHEPEAPVAELHPREPEVAPEPAPTPPSLAPSPVMPPPELDQPARTGGLSGFFGRKRSERAAPPPPPHGDSDHEQDFEAGHEERYGNLAGARSLEPPMMEGIRPAPAVARRIDVDEDEKPSRGFDVHEDEERPRRDGIGRLLSGTLGTILIAIALVAIVGGVLFWQRDNIKNGLVSLLSLGPSQTAQAPRDNAPPARSKIPDRIGQAGQAQPEQAKKPEAPATQNVVLYEEDPNDPNGKRYTGTVVWSLENVAAGPGQPMDKAIRGDITIPERNMTVTFTLRRNTDKDLPASHTVSINFNVPADFSHKGIQEIRGLLMKQSESTRGVALAGLSVKVTNGFFLIGLSASEGDVQRNIQMLKERGWFDIAIVYDDNRRAILAVEKGPQGERVFNEAFAAWGQ
jgi:hypothetical protein